MNFITVRVFGTSPGKIGKQSPVEQEMVTTNKGKPIALLTPLSDADLENTIKAVRIARAINAVWQMQEISIKNKNNLLSEDEIQRVIDVCRNRNQ